MTHLNLPNRDPDCKIISIVSEKGGSGKTTLAYLLASAGIAKGLRVHCVDTDRNPQFLNWKGSCERAHPTVSYDFPKNLTASKLPSDTNAIEYHLAEKSRESDILIIDTRPGRYEDIEDAAYASDVILIPGMPKSGEINLLSSTCDWMFQCRSAFPDMDSYPPIVVPIINADLLMLRAFEEEEVDPLAEADYAIYKRMCQLTCLPVVIPTSRVIERLGLDGPLTMQMDMMKGRNTLYIRRVLERSIRLLDDIIDLQPIVRGK